MAPTHHLTNVYLVSACARNLPPAYPEVTDYISAKCPSIEALVFVKKGVKVQACLVPPVQPGVCSRLLDVLQLTWEHVLAILFVSEGAQRFASFLALLEVDQPLDVYHVQLPRAEYRTELYQQLMRLNERLPTDPLEGGQ